MRKIRTAAGAFKTSSRGARSAKVFMCCATFVAFSSCGRRHEPARTPARVGEVVVLVLPFARMAPPVCEPGQVPAVVKRLSNSKLVRLSHSHE